MTQSEAFEFLARLIGRDLAINGVHGESLRLIAEKVEALQQDLDTLKSHIFQALNLHVEENRVVVISSPDPIPPHGFERIRHIFGKIPVLMINDDMEIKVEDLQEVIKRLQQRVVETSGSE